MDSLYHKNTKFQKSIRILKQFYCAFLLHAFECLHIIDWMEHLLQYPTEQRIFPVVNISPLEGRHPDDIKLQ